MPEWKRPETVPFPSIWRKFEGRKPINGKIPKFWIQDIPEEMFEDAVEMMSSNFVYDEPLCRFANLTRDELSVIELKERWRDVVRHKVGLICFMENPGGKPIIAGVNMTYISEKDDELPKIKGEQWLKVFDTVRYLCLQVDAHEKLGIDVYMNALGLSVLPEFRGQGIGLELLNSRSDLGRAVGLKATLTVFSAITSQKLAEKSGFKDLFSIGYDELEKIEPRFSYPGITEDNKNIRYMYKMIE